MAIFNQPAENMSGAVGFLQYIDYLTGGILGLGLLVTVAIVAFISTKSFPFDRSFAYSMFFTSIVAIFLFFLGLIGGAVLTFVIIMLAISMVVLWRERDVEEP